MRRLSLMVLALGMAAVVVAAGRAWNPRVEDWTAEPPAGWRGLDGPGFTLACPNRFVFRTDRPRRGEAEMTIQPAGAEFVGLRIYVFTTAVPQASLRPFLIRQLGIGAAQHARLIRVGPLEGRGESGTLASGRLWKAMAIEANEAIESPRGPTFRSGRGSLPANLSEPLRTLIAVYEQVPATDRPIYDQMLGSIRLRPGGG